MLTTTQVAEQLASAVGTGDFERGLELIAPDAVDHSPLPGAPPGHEGWRKKWESLVAQAGQVEIAVEQRVADGDTIATRYAIRAVDSGEAVGFALDMIRVRDGRVVEHWALPMPSGMVLAEGG